MEELREAQLKYELSADNAAQAAKLREYLLASASGDTSLPRATLLLGRVMKEVVVHLTRDVEVKTRGVGAKYKTWLRALPIDVAAVIAIRECIRMCSSPDTYVRVQDLCSNIGKLWELEVRIRQAEKVNPLYMQRVHEGIKDNCTQSLSHIRAVYNKAIAAVFKGSIEYDLTKSDMMHIGKFGADACFDAGLIEIVRGTDKNGMTVSYILSDDIMEFLHGYDHNDVRNLLNKQESRMICPPDPWTNTYDGGYISVRRKANAPLLNVGKLRKAARAPLAAEFVAEKMPEVFSAGNYLQGTAFRLHAPTRAAIVRVWGSGGGIMGVPQKSAPQRDPFPFHPEWHKDTGTPDELVVFNKWKRDTAMHYVELREWKGKVREVGAFMRTSEDTEHDLWFPVYCDTRGRWYYRGIPNPQGSDMSKAVLHFSKKKALGARGVYWLKVHIANSFGYDKERFDDRARWTEQHWADIERALDAPEDHPEVWGTDAPWCMFSAAWELREAYRSGDPSRYATGIPVHMDATCSGLQHFSALLRDPIGGMYVNLTDPTKCGPKQDIYGRVASMALELIRRDMESGDPETASIAKWVHSIGIPRVLAKKPVNFIGRL